MGSDLENSFIEKVKANHRIIRKVCWIYATEEADREDLYQETVLNAWKAYPAFRGESKFSTWLYRVALNTAMYGDRKRHKQLVSIDQAKGKSTAPNQLDEHERLHYAINQLNAIEKSIIILFMEELSYREIGDIVGLTESNVGVRLTRVKKKLKKILQKNGI